MKKGGTLRVAVIGGGASGLMCALYAKNGGLDVTVYEKNPRPGKKLLGTGNGRCNFTNRKLTVFSRLYNGGDSYLQSQTEQTQEEGYGDERGKIAFSSSYVKGERRGPSVYNDGRQKISKDFYNNDAFAEKFLLVNLEKEFARLGLMSFSDGEGRVYPLTGSAKTLLDCVMRALEGVNFKYNCEICAVKKIKEEFILSDKQSSYKADAVVLATGGSARALCDNKRLLPEGVLTETLPSLTPLLTRNDLKQLDGIRHGCKVSLYSGNFSLLTKKAAVKNERPGRFNNSKSLNGKIAEGIQSEAAESVKLLRTETGEVQFRSFGLSGIVCFNMSAIVARKMREGERDFTVSLDLFPQISDSDLMKLLYDRNNIYGNGLFLGLLNEKLAKEAEKRVGCINSDNIPSYAAVLKNMVFGLNGLAGFDMAQITCGGVRTELLTDCLEMKGLDGFYVCGEAADIDGLCGGYNLAWAFSSGIVVGKEIVRKTR